MNTLTALLAGYDFSDPFYASGGELRLEHPLAAGWEGEARARVERHRSARRTAEFSVFGGADHFRPVEPVDEGTLLGASFHARRRIPPEVGQGWGAAISVDGGRLAGEGAGFTFLRPLLDAAWVRRAGKGAELLLEGSVGAALGDAPRQAGFRIGGRGTVPGFEFRSLEGDRFAVARATASADLVPRFVRGRLTASAGGAWAEPDTAYGSPPAPQPLHPPRRTAVSLGAGVGIFFDILRLDVARGLGAGGRWEVIVEASPAFWDFL